MSDVLKLMAFCFCFGACIALMITPLVIMAYVVSRFFGTP